MQEKDISDKMLDLIARRFRTLGEPIRLRILQALEAAPHTVGELVEALDASQPNISKHLQILHDAGLVGRERLGTSIRYSISDPMVLKLCDLVCNSEARKSRRNVQELGAAIVKKGKR